MLFADMYEMQGRASYAYQVYYIGAEGMLVVDEAEEEVSGMGYATSIRSEIAEIVYEKEIPLALQVITDKNEVVSYEVDYFEHSEEYEKLGYEYVYAITVCFSQEPLS